MDLIAFLAGLLLGLILVGLFYQSFGARCDRRRLTGSGRWIEIGRGQNLFLVEKGVGRATVVFESGIAATHLNWCRIQSEVSVFAPTVSYDRAGLGWSSPCASPRTPSNIAAELHAMLGTAESRPPYVLVGHSFGGFVMRRFAALYPDEVASVVLVDPMRCEEWPPVDKTSQAIIDRGVRLARIAIPIARVGVARIAVTSLLCRSGRTSRWLTRTGGDGARQVMGRVRDEISKIAREVWPIIAAHWSRPAFYAGMRAHIEAVPGSVREMLVADPIRGAPVTVLTPDSSEPLSEQCLDSIGENVRQIIVPQSGHWVHLDQPLVVIEAIRAVVGTVSQRTAEATI